MTAKLTGEVVLRAGTAFQPGLKKTPATIDIMHFHTLTGRLSVTGT